MTNRIPHYESVADGACRLAHPSGMVGIKKTSQGYARKRTLKPGGSFICGGGLA